MTTPVYIRNPDRLPTQGPAGPIGPAGPAGPSGATATYTHSQSIPSATWTIVHNLGYRPAVTVLDSAGTNVEGDVSYPDVNTTIIEFTAAFGGVAYLS